MIPFKPTPRKALPIIGAASLIILTTGALSAESIRMLLVTGGHPYDFDSFHAMFEQMEEVDVTHVELEDHSEVFEDIGGWRYDTIVLYNMTHELSDHRLENLFTLTEWGVGIVPLHHGTLSWTSQPRVKEIFGVQFPDVGPFGFHLNQEFTYEIVDSGHPVTHGMESFDVIDETYTNWYGEGVDGNHVLITTDHEPSDPELVWARHVNNSRILSIQGGHDRLTFENPNYIELLHRAILWTSGRLPLEVGGAGLPNSTLYREYYELPALIGSMAQYDATQSREALSAVERRLLEEPTPEILAALVEIAMDDSLSRAVRTWSLRQLGYHGSEANLADIAPLLLDPEMANISRYTFEQSLHAGADQILLDAFHDSAGDIRRGIAITMTRRQSAGIIDALQVLLDAEEPMDIEIGATGFAEIGGQDALRAMESKAAEVKGDSLITLQESLLTWAGISPGEDSTRLYREIKKSGETSILRASAWLGYLTSSEQALDEMPEALTSSDPMIRSAAINAIPRVSSDRFMGPLLDTFPALGTAGQIAVLYALEERGSAAGLPIVHAALEGDDSEVVVNASYVAGSFGDKETAGLLIDLLAGAPSVTRNLTIKSLAAIPGGEIDDMIVASLESNEADKRAGLIEVLAERLTISALDVIFAHTDDEATPVRSAAYSALGDLGDDDTFARVLSQFMEIESTTDLRFANRTLTELRRRSDAQDEQLSLILSALPSATETQAGLLIGTIATGSTDSAAEALETLLESESEPLRLAAIRSLSSWPNAAPAESLLAIAGGGSGRESALAARGYLTILSRDGNIRSGERLEWARRIAAHLDTPALKTQYISVVSSSPSLEALNEVVGFLDDEDVQREAFQAIEQLSPDLSLVYPEEVLAALTQMAESPDLPGELRTKAGERIEFLREYSDRVVANWNFFDGTDGWLAENQCTLESHAGYLHAISYGDDPFISIEVDIPQQPLVVQFRVRHEEAPGLFQFFIRTDEVEMGYPGSMINIEPKPSDGDWVEYEVPFTPVGNMEVFRFDFAIVPIEVDIDYIRLLKPQ